MPPIVTRPAGTKPSPTNTAPEPIDHLRPYVALGCDVLRQHGSTQAVGTCPFCGKENKFAVSVVDGKWRCYVCAEGNDRTAMGGGNVYTFIAKLHAHSAFPDARAAEFAKERKLTRMKTLEEWGFRVNSLTNEWIIPSYNADGKMNNVYTYKSPSPGAKRTLIPTGGLKIGMFGLHLYDKEKPYLDVLEGPWDAMAYYEIMRIARQVDGKLDLTGSQSASLYALTNVIAVPGANNWQDAWNGVAESKRVTLLFDNDHPRLNEASGKTTQAGLDGAKRTARVLLHGDKKPTSVNAVFWGTEGWTAELADGFDVRDHLGQKSHFRDRVPLLSSLLDKVQPISADWVPGRTADAVATGGSEVQLVDCTSYDQLIAQWSKAMQWSEPGTGLDHAFAVMLASVASVRMPDDQLWVQVISPPSTGKTTLAEGIETCVKYTRAIGSFTGLHSGYMSDSTGEEDNSLITQLKDKTLIIKDGDTLLRASNRDKLLAEMRDAYDTNTSAHYRNKVKRDYRGHRFGIIICGTNSLLELDSSELGARYLNCIIADGIDEQHETNINRKRFRQLWNVRGVEANGDLSTHTNPDKTLAKQMTGGYVLYLRENAADLLGNIEMTAKDQKTVEDKFDRYARFVAYLRSRPSKKQDEVLSSREMSARLMVQLSKLGLCLAVVMNKTRVDADVMKRVRRVTLDTARGKMRDLCDVMHEYGRSGVAFATLVARLHETDHNVKVLLKHLRHVKVVETYRPVSKVRKGGKTIQKQIKWRLTDPFNDLYETIVVKEK